MACDQYKWAENHETISNDFAFMSTFISGNVCKRIYCRLGLFCTIIVTNYVLFSYQENYWPDQTSRKKVFTADPKDYITFGTAFNLKIKQTVKTKNKDEV